MRKKRAHKVKKSKSYATFESQNVFLMAKLKISDEWWTAPAEGDNGELILVTGRRNMYEIMASKIFNDRIEVTWNYAPQANGLPDESTSKLMEQVHDALRAEFDKDPVAIMTGIYTGAGERNWIFYTRSINIFGRKLNEILAPFELLPLSIYAEKDSEWNEYREMRLTEIDDSEI